MKNLLYISEQEKKNILRMHGILNEEERNYDGSTWGYFTGGTSGKKLYFDERHKDYSRVWPFQKLINKKFEPINNEAEIEVWSSGCVGNNKNYCECVTKHKMTFSQSWNKNAGEFNLNMKYYYLTNQPTYVRSVNEDPLYYDIPKLDITTFDRQDFIISLFGTEADAKQYREKLIKISGYTDKCNMLSIGLSPSNNINKDDVNMIYYDNNNMDKDYRYLKSGNDWFARNKAKDGPVFNLSQKSRDNKNKYQSSIDNLENASSGNDGKRLEKDSSTN